MERISLVVLPDHNKATIQRESRFYGADISWCYKRRGLCNDYLLGWMSEDAKFNPECNQKTATSVNTQNQIFKLESLSGPKEARMVQSILLRRLLKKAILSCSRTTLQLLFAGQTLLLINGVPSSYHSSVIGLSLIRSSSV